MREDIAKSMPDMSKGGSPNILSEKNMETWANHNVGEQKSYSEKTSSEIDHGYSEEDYYVRPYELSDEELETLIQRLQNARNHYNDIGDNKAAYWQDKLEAAVEEAKQRGLSAGRSR